MYRYNLGLTFEEVVSTYPDNIALKFSLIKSITYQELNIRANKIAHFLKDNGVRRKDVVCISNKKNLNTYACMIACLKIGAIYTIIDRKSPVQRLHKILSVCSPKLLIIDQKLKKSLEVIDVLQYNIQESNFDNITRDISNADNLSETYTITGTNPAYIMFTSGSTGFPKGVLISHANVLNLILWAKKEYDFSSNDVLTNVNPLYFDNSVFDFYSSLFIGASLVPFSIDTTKNPKMIVELIDECRCTSWFSVPSLLIYMNTMKVFHSDNMRCIKRYIFGGEGYPKSQLKMLFDMYSHRCDFYNVYGPTECTCICSSYKVSSDDFETLQGFAPLGKIAKNFDYLILNENNNSSDTGELCLLGPNVGLGYFNNIESTRNSYMQNPQNVRYNEIMYKTGDLVNYDQKDGYLYFVGRKDYQIKHMGYRIELEEIESALNSLDYVIQSVALYGKINKINQIICIVSADQSINEQQIKTELSDIIPSYMLPTRIIIERELPKNQNGKIDKKKLKDNYLPA